MENTKNKAAGGGSSPSSCSPVFPLRWDEVWDEEAEYDNHQWESASPYHDDGRPFMFRIRQRLREDKHEFFEASDAEAMMDEEDPRFWPTLEEAKAALQQDADDIVRSYRENDERRGGLQALPCRGWLAPVEVRRKHADRQMVEPEPDSQANQSDSEVHKFGECQSKDHPNGSQREDQAD